MNEHGCSRLVKNAVMLAMFVVALSGCRAKEEAISTNNINEPVGSNPTINHAPSIQGIPNTSVQVGSSFVFDASASDPEGDSLTFSITSVPVWATFNKSNSELSGTPAATHVAKHSNISISVTDGEFTVTVPTFSITVSAVVVPNSSPAISGTPLAVSQGESAAHQATLMLGCTRTFGFRGRAIMRIR